MAQNVRIPTWDELIDMMSNPESHRPDDIGWNIYRYLNTHYETMASQEVRTLLLCYLKVPTSRPSLLHSCILSLAVKIAKKFDDFKFAPFLSFWGTANLRSEDCQQQKGKDCKSYPSLLEKVTHAYMSSCLRFGNTSSDKVPEILTSEAQRLGYLSPIPTVAVKMFETEHNGRKMRSVKLIAGDGQEFLVDSHLFNVKPWEIVGKMYTVLPRKAKDSGNIRIAELAPSTLSAAEVFGRVIGYVDRYDTTHNHYHIYDSLSRHLVAENPMIKPQVGEFVWFAPIIPQVDKFKSAIIIAKEERQAAQESFGIKEATITYVNTEKDFFRYKIAENDEGTATTSIFFPTPPAVGIKIRIIVYLRRGKDGVKRNYLAQIIS